MQEIQIQDNDLPRDNYEQNVINRGRYADLILYQKHGICSSTKNT